MIGRIATAAFLAAGLAGCASGPSRTNFAAGQTAMNADPQLRRDAQGLCVDMIGASTPYQRNYWASVMHTTPRAAPRVFCSRFMRGVASGRVNYDDINAARAGTLTPNMRSVLRGG